MQPVEVTVFSDADASSQPGWTAAEKSIISTGMETPVLSGAQRGRPREFDPDQALTAALTVFWRRGYEAASLTELTDAMGITRPSLYACFGNKEALFRKALDLYERDKLAYIQAALEAPTARGVAGAIVARRTGNADERVRPEGLSRRHRQPRCGAEAESIRAEVLARRASSDAALIERFKRGKAEGDLPDAVDPESLARYLGAVLQGLAIQASGGVACQDLAKLVDTTLMFWPGR